MRARIAVAVDDTDLSLMPWPPDATSDLTNIAMVLAPECDEVTAIVHFVGTKANVFSKRTS
jgi:hypothetical protein